MKMREKKNKNIYMYTKNTYYFHFLCLLLSMFFRWMQEMIKGHKDREQKKNGMKVTEKFLK